MPLDKILLIAQMVCLGSVGILILLQQRGVGLSSVFGGGNQVYMTRRGVEKYVMVATVTLIVAFCVLRLANLYLVPSFK